jgi:hypothetical protein
MQPWRTLRFIAMFVGGLLVAMTSVYADHFAAGGGKYSLTSDSSETSVRFQFLGVASSSSVTDGFVPVIQTTIKCTVVHKRGDISFRLFASGADFVPFMVKRLKPPKEFPRSVTFTGKMLSKLVVGAGPDRRQFTEIAPFEAVGVDVTIPGAGKDSFTLKIDYSANQDIAPMLLEVLGTKLVNCKTDADICTLTVTGTLTDGENEVHTASGE